jgi:hypothetical protein
MQEEAEECHTIPQQMGVIESRSIALEEHAASAWIITHHVAYCLPSASLARRLRLPAYGGVTPIFPLVICYAPIMDFIAL